MTYRTHKKSFKHSLTARNLGYRTATVRPEEAMAAMLAGKTVIVDGSTKSTLRCPPGYTLKCRAVGNGQYECKCRSNNTGSEDLKDPFAKTVDPIVESRAGASAPNLREAPRLSVKANVRHRQGIRSGAKKSRR